MARFGLIGPTYTSQSPTADAERTMNRYLEQMESPNAKSAFTLYQCAGTRMFCELPDSPNRGSLAFNGREFQVAGSTLFELFADGSFVARGTIANDGLPASLACNQAHQMVICSAGIVYLFNLATDTLSAPSGMLGLIAQVVFCDGYFVALLDNSNRFQVSDLLDGGTWPGVQTGEIQVFAENVVSMSVDHRELWFRGSLHSVVYYNTGSVQVFDPIGPAAYLESGSAARWAEVHLDNTLFWIEQSERGRGIARRANGYNPARVSNHAVEYRWSKYPTISDAIGYAYEDQGHAFWQTYFPSANETWVYDVSTGMWFERGYWNQDQGRYSAHRSMCHAFAFGKHLVGDPLSGKVYDMSIAYFDDDGNPLRRLRVSPPISIENQWIRHDSLEIDMEVGLGPVPPLTGGFPEGVLALYLEDANGQVWAVTINDDGTLQYTVASGQTPQQVFLIDYVNGTTAWQLIMTFNNVGEPVLATVSTTLYAWYPVVIKMGTSPSFLQAALFVDNNGQLNTNEGSAVPRPTQIIIRWSDDGGKTWSNERKLSAGLAGEYKTRVITRRLGRSRNRIYEISESDPFPSRIIEGYVIASPGFGVSERQTKQLAKGV